MTGTQGVRGFWRYAAKRWRIKNIIIFGALARPMQWPTRGLSALGQTMLAESVPTAAPGAVARALTAGPCGALNQ